MLIKLAIGNIYSSYSKTKISSSYWR